MTTSAHHQFNSIGTRTSLFPLALAQTNQGDPEHLRSYILRLAYAHRFRPRVMQKVLVDAHYPDEFSNGHYRMFTSCGRGIITNGKGCREFCHMLMRESGQTNLQSGTLLSLENHVSPQDLITKSERVCLSCIRADEFSGGPMYFRLLWRLKDVNCCPIHGERLLDLSEQTPHLPFISQENAPVKVPGVCSVCASVGYECLHARQFGTDAEIRRATWYRNFLIDIRNEPLPDPIVMKEAFLTFACSIDRGTSEICKAAGVPKGLVSRWQNEAGARMQLSSGVAIAMSLNISCHELFSGKLGGAFFVLGRPLERRSRPKRKFDRAFLVKELQMAIDNPEGSLIALVKRLGIDRKTLRQADEKLFDFLKARGRASRDRERHEIWQSAWNDSVKVLHVIRQNKLRLHLRVASQITNTTWTPSTPHGIVFRCLSGNTLEPIARRSSVPEWLRTKIAKSVSNQIM